MMMRGQGSSEYLIVLAVVLVVSLVTIVLVGGFPAMGGDARKAESSQYWIGSAKPFSITEQTQINTTVYMTLLNTESARFIIRNITLTSGNNVFYPLDMPAAGLTLGGGSKKTITITNVTRCNATSYDEYEYNVRITYDTSDITGKLESGSKPIIGRCVVE